MMRELEMWIEDDIVKPNKMTNNLKGTHNMIELTDFELLVLTRCIGGLNCLEFRKSVNHSCEKKVTPSLLESSDVNQSIYHRLQAAAKMRGIDLETGVVERTITTTEHLI